MTPLTISGVGHERYAPPTCYQCYNAAESEDVTLTCIYLYHTHDVNAFVIFCLEVLHTNI